MPPRSDEKHRGGVGVHCSSERQTCTGAEPTRATSCAAFPPSHEEGGEVNTPWSAMHASRAAPTWAAHRTSAERTSEHAGSMGFVWV